jgi:hypothetical protein
MLSISQVYMDISELQFNIKWPLPWKHVTWQIPSSTAAQTFLNTLNLVKYLLKRIYPTSAHTYNAHVQPPNSWWKLIFLILLTVTVLLDVMTCGYVKWYRHFRGTISLHHWGWGCSLKHQYTCSRQHSYSVSSKKTAIFKLLRTQTQHPHENMLHVFP